MKHFPYRKLMLFKNTRALITCPGGYGTLDELFEIWVMPHQGPMVVTGVVPSRPAKTVSPLGTRLPSY